MTSAAARAGKVVLQEGSLSSAGDSNHLGELLDFRVGAVSQDNVGNFNFRPPQDNHYGGEIAIGVAGDGEREVVAHPVEHIRDLPRCV